MPIYDYSCAKCGHRFEKLVPLADRNENQECPMCKSEFGKHIITPVHFHLPGNDLAFPTAADKWTREHEKAGRDGRKREEEQAKEMASSMY